MEIDLKFIQKTHHKGTCEEGFSSSNNQNLYFKKCNNLDMLTHTIYFIDASNLGLNKTNHFFLNKGATIRQHLSGDLAVGIVVFHVFAIIIILITYKDINKLTYSLALGDALGIVMWPIMDQLIDVILQFSTKICSHFNAISDTWVEFYTFYCQISIVF